MNDVDWWRTDAQPEDVGVIADRLTDMHVARLRVALGGRLAGRGAWGLDLGCGWGRLLVPVADTYPRADFMGVDVIARAHPDRRWPRNARWMATDGRSLTLVAETIDAAWSVALFQHLPGDTVRGWLIELSRVLRPGGVVCFQFVERCDDTPDSVRAYKHRRADVAGWCARAGFQLVGTEADAETPEWVWCVAEKP